MPSKALKLTYATKNGVGVSIDDVESGLKCGCICPACGEPLVAKKGTKVMHHFAHYSGSTCEYGYETALHLMAKDILSSARTMMIPEVYVQFPYSTKEELQFSEAREISIEKVELEKHFQGLVPDVVIYSGAKRFFLEIFVTHPVDKGKLEKIKKEDISCLEIDLSKTECTVSYHELQQILLENSQQKKWIYNRVATRKLHEFYFFSERIRIVMHGLAVHAEHCPIRAREWRGKSYANVIDDCAYCPYKIAYFTDEETTEEILCSGKYRLNTLQDLIRVEKQSQKNGGPK